MELRRPALEHGTTRTGRWLRERRVKIALWLAVAEGVLIVFDVIPKWLALVVALAVIGFYLFLGRGLQPYAARQAAWIAALSQAFVGLVPVFLFLLTALAVFALGVLALIAVVALFADRR